MQGYKEIKWYEEIAELLNKLNANGVKTAIATLKAYATMLKILEAFDTTDKFDAVFGAYPDKPATKVQLLENCIDKLQYQKKIRCL